MRLYPAIDLREGATVQLVGGDETQEAYHDPDPIKVAHRWANQGASLLHVVDLDAALGLGTNMHVVDRILNTVPLPIQLGGGVRSLVDIQSRLDMGVGRVIIGTQGIEQPQWLETAVDLFPGKIMLAIDARGDEVAVKGWKEGSGLSLSTVLERVDDLHLAGVLYTNVDIEGSLKGVDRGAVERVMSATQHDVVASGGIGTEADLDVLADVGVAGAVLGMSIYSGQIKLKEAIQRIEGRQVEEDQILIPRPAVQWGGVPEDAPQEAVVRAPGEMDDEELERLHREAGPSPFVEPDTDPRDHEDDAPAVGPKAGVWGKRRRARREEDEDEDEES